jgi:hypothetical protein
MMSRITHANTAVRMRGKNPRDEGRKRHQRKDIIHGEVNVLEKMPFYGVTGGGTAGGNLDFAIDRGQVVVNGTWADD